MAIYIRSCNIKAYRGIKDLDIDSLGDVNIIVGNNNSGKTSLLEAIRVLANPSDYTNIIKIARGREISRGNLRFSISLFDAFLNVFPKRKDQEAYELELSADTIYGEIYTKIEGFIEQEIHDINEEKLYNFDSSMNEGNIIEVPNFLGELTYSSPVFSADPIQMRTIDNVSHIKTRFEYLSGQRILIDRQAKEFLKVCYLSANDYTEIRYISSIIRDKLYLQKVIEVLKIFDSNIQDIRIIENDNHRIVPMLDDSEFGFMPLSLYGDGMKKAIAIAGSIAKASGGILLIDEVETAIHTSGMEELFKFIIKACKQQEVQVFLTTHSEEALGKLLDCEMNNQEMRVLTLVKKDKTLVRNLDRNKARKAKDLYGQELRG